MAAGGRPLNIEKGCPVWTGRRRGEEFCDMQQTDVRPAVTIPENLNSNLEFLVIKQCAPTLANLKSAGLFSTPFEDREAFRAEVRRLDSCLRQKNVRLTILRERRNRALVYCYRPCRLQRDMAREDTCRFLEANGYCCEELGIMLARLSLRLCEEGCFPHEIGLFLGYPFADVMGFICHKGQNYKCCADWKVYGDEEGCRALFDAYKACREDFIARWRAGESIYRLTLSA